MKIEYPVSEAYLETWGAYEGIREFLQNAKDGEVELDAKMTVRFRKGGDGYPGVIVIENEGTKLPHEALLFGFSTKRERADLIGKFGEGLKLGALACVRAGHLVTIRSGGEVWRPTIVDSEKFKARVLAFEITSGNADKNRVQVEIGGVAEADWLEMKKRFLWLSSGRGDKNVIKTDQGTLLLSQDRKGHVFVKGIFVEHKAGLGYGYDLADGELDRDRKMVSTYDLRYRVNAIWRDALSRRPDLIEAYEKLLEGEEEDVAGIESSWDVSRLPEAAKQKIADTFVERHGENAVPVSTLADSHDVEHLGKRGIVCPKPLRLVLEQKLGTLEANKDKLGKAVVKVYGWHELEASEKANLERALFLVRPAAQGIGCELSLADVDVIDCRDEKIQGLFANGRVQVTKKILGSRDLTLLVLVHETAHKAGGADGDKSHVANIEVIWSAIVSRLSEVAS